MKYLKATLLGSGALASLLLSSVLTGCQDEDFGYTAEEIRAAAYDRNFVAKYGEIAPDQSWDFSKFAVQNFSGTRAMPSENNCDFDKTDVGIASQISLDIEDEWYYVEPHLLEAFNRNLGEGIDNTKQGSFNFEFTSTGAPFYIVPLFQGISGLQTDLHMEVTYKGETYDKQIWKKGQNLQKQVYGNLNWTTISETEEAFSNYYNKAEYEALYEASSFGAVASRSKPVRCIVPAGATIKMYVHVTKGRLANNVNTTNGNEYHDNNLAYTGVKQYSDGGKMISLSESLFEVPDAAKQRFGEHAMIIGCEDASYGTETVTVYRKENSTIKSYEVEAGQSFDGATVSKWNGDNDMNDLVFMFVSDDLPDVKEKDVIRKRYLIEDLGSVVDWDFNDVVVDVYQRSEKGEIVEQKAMIRQKCGTTDFDIMFKVGNQLSGSVFGRQHGRVRDAKADANWDKNMPEVTTGEEITFVDLSNFKVSGQWPWNHETNNIVVRVYPETNRIDESKPNIPNGDGNYPSTGAIDSDGVSSDDPSTPTNQDMANSENLVHFPERGQVPRIIAVDTDFPWSPENIDIDGNLWNFREVTTTAIKVNDIDAGVASGGGNHRVGSKVTIKAIPNPGYEFDRWSDGSTDATREITVASSESNSYEAQFKTRTSDAEKSFNVTVNVEGSGYIDSYWTQNVTYPKTFTISYINTDGSANDLGAQMVAVPNNGNKFLYWSDDKGNIQMDNATITVKNESNVTAHFAQENTRPLVIRIAKEDWDNWKTDKNSIKIYINDNGTIKDYTPNDNGQVSTTVNNEKVTVVVNINGLNSRDIKYQWSIKGNTNGSDTYETWDVGTGEENSISSNISNGLKEAKKQITVPLAGSSSSATAANVVTIGITSQVLIQYALRENNTVPTSSTNRDVSYGSAKINNTNSRQVYLHKNSTFNLSATPKDGYHFYGWYNGDNNSNFVSNQPVLREQKNDYRIYQNQRIEDGQYYITAVFEMNPTHQLQAIRQLYTFGTQNPFTDGASAGDVNLEWGSISGKNTINVPANVSVTATATTNSGYYHLGWRTFSDSNPISISEQTNYTTSNTNTTEYNPHAVYVQLSNMSTTINQATQFNSGNNSTHVLTDHSGFSSLISTAKKILIIIDLDGSNSSTNGSLLLKCGDYKDVRTKWEDNSFSVSNRTISFILDETDIQKIKNNSSKFFLQYYYDGDTQYIKINKLRYMRIL